MKIYLDIFFLVNACMNVIVLVAECMFRKRRIRLGRILLAASVGAGLATGILVCGVHTYKILFVLLYLPGVFVPVYIAFGKTTFRAFIGNVVSFFVMSGLLAAVLMQLQGITGLGGRISLLLLGSAVFLVALYRFLPCFERENASYKNYYRVSLYYRGRKISGTGLLDTGNQLSEPFGHEPVSIAPESFLRPFLERGEETLFRYIPFHSIGNKGSVIRVFRIDEMVIEGPHRQKIQISEPWIAAAKESISTNQEYQVILHPDMFTIRQTPKQ